MDSISVRFPDATWMAIYGCVARQSCCIWDQQSQGTRFSMFMFVTLSCRKSLSENVFKKTACVFFFFFRISIRQKATLASGMCATRMHRPKNNFKLMKLLGSVEFPSGPGFRGFMVDHHLPIANVNGKLVSEKPSNLGKMSMFPRMGGWKQCFSLFHFEFSPFLERIWGSGPYPPWCCSPFEASGTIFCCTTLILLTVVFVSQVFCERPGKKTWNRPVCGMDRQLSQSGWEVERSLPCGSSTFLKEELPCYHDFPLLMPRNPLGFTGVVFSLHGNGIAVVDFLGNWGWALPVVSWIQKISFDDLLSIPWGFECPTFDLEMVEDPWFKKNDQGWELGKLIVLQVCLEFTLGWKGSFCDGSWNNQHTQWMWIPQQYPAKFHIGGTDLHVVSFDSVSMQSVASSTLSSLGLTWEELFNASCGLLVCQSPCWIF